MLLRLGPRRLAPGLSLRFPARQLHERDRASIGGCTAQADRAKHRPQERDRPRVPTTSRSAPLGPPPAPPQGRPGPRAGQRDPGAAPRVDPLDEEVLGSLLEFRAGETAGKAHERQLPRENGGHPAMRVLPPRRAPSAGRRRCARSRRFRPRRLRHQLHGATAAWTGCAASSPQGCLFGPMPRRVRRSGLTSLAAP